MSGVSCLTLFHLAKVVQLNEATRFPFLDVPTEDDTVILVGVVRIGFLGTKLRQLFENVVAFPAFLVFDPHLVELCFEYGATDCNVFLMAESTVVADCGFADHNKLLLA